MPKLSSDFKQVISKLSYDELIKIVFRFARKNKEMYETLSFEYLQDDSAEELFEDVKQDIDFHFSFVEEGRVIQKNLAKAISNSIQDINEFKKVTKNKKLEADSLVFLLCIVFDRYEEDLGTCWTIFDSKVATTLNRLINLVRKIHPDYWIEYKKDIDRFIKIMKEKSGSIQTVYKMPNTFEIDKFSDIAEV